MKWFFALFFAFSFIFLTIFGVNCVYGYLFPIKYSEVVENASETFNVDEAVIYSLINIESHFNKDAVSSKGAVGLMQVMPSTAESLAKEFDLHDPHDNIFLGTQYIAKLINRFGNLETAVCAYNAGPTKVSKWLEDERYSDDQKTLKNIPFDETRGYLEKFKRNLKYYKTKKF